MIHTQWRSEHLKRTIIPYIFILPFLSSYILFFIYPAFYSLILSFYRYRGYGKATFIGLANYINLINYGTMWRTLGNTFFYFIGSFIPVTLAAFTTAMLVRSKPVRNFQNIYKPIIFLPQVCAVVASSLCFKIIFGERVGVFSQILGTPIPFLSETSLMRWSVVALITWRAIGWYFIIYLSGLTTISEDILEAATIDGTNSLQTTWYITIPLMKPIFMLAFITNAIGSLKIYIEPNLLLASNYDPPMQAAPYINIILNSMQGGQFGMACAAGWVLVLVIFLLTLVQLRIFKDNNQ
ncbi:lactose ABC transporter permease [Spirochaetia bacterium]|nr:lactose ABC transporter permease [Spirochaetia bacterium]